MIESKRKYRVFLSAAEPSADAHCAALISALFKSGYEIEVVGVGGEKMRQAGCELLEETTNRAAMTYNAFGQVFYFRGVLKRIRQYFKEKPVDLVVVCDSPAFNFHVAKTAKKHGAKTLFYVAPQLWAWAPRRIRKLKKWCDKLCCILPFEQQWFGQRGVEAEFVGNPLLENLQTVPRAEKKHYQDFEPSKAKIALMPGSREAELKSLWVPMQQIAVRLKNKFPQSSFTTVAVDDARKQMLQSKQIDGFECHYVTDSVYDTAKRCDFSIVASGSATLQVAAANCPMVIMYQSSKFLWHLVGCRLVTTKYLSLVNILAQKELVPEYMPYFTSIEPIAEKIKQLLQDHGKLEYTSAKLAKLVKPLAVGKASEQVSNLAIQMLTQ
ncbi:MAG: lipid-A-disaccharide synthase [Phycisphaerales bacterium]|jgi:lipid-A-disaccharide synthase